MAATAPVPPFWRRRLLPAALAVAALNLVAFLAFTLPRSVRLASVTSRAGKLREEVGRERGRNATLRLRVDNAARNAQDLERFYRELVGRREESLLPILEELEAMTHKPGLLAGRRGFTRDEVKGVPLTRVAISLPLEGSYEQLVRFLENLERGKRFITVDRIAISQNQNAGDRGRAARLLVELSAFFKETPARSADGD